MKASEFMVRDWFSYLNEKIRFPFEAEVCEYQEGELICQGDRLKVHSIEGEDDLYGVIVSVRKGRKKYSFPLVDLEPISFDGEGKKAIDEYKYGLVIDKLLGNLGSLKMNLSNILKGICQ